MNDSGCGILVMFVRLNCSLSDVKAKSLVVDIEDEDEEFGDSVKMFREFGPIIDIISGHV